MITIIIIIIIIVNDEVPSGYGEIYSLVIDGAIVSRSELVVTFGSPNRGRSAATRRLATARHRTQHDLDLSHHARLESQPRGGKETELQPAPASELQAVQRASIPATKAYADARRPCVQPRTQAGNPSTTIRSRGPVRAVWAGPTPPPGGEVWQAEKAMPSCYDDNDDDDDDDDGG